MVNVVVIEVKTGVRIDQRREEGQTRKDPGAACVHITVIDVIRATTYARVIVKTCAVYPHLESNRRARILM